MAPAVQAGQYFLAWSPPGPLARGDLVIFRYQDQDGAYDVLRRLAALPGDTIAMVDGGVVLNGVTQRWAYRVIEPAARFSPLARTGDLYTWGPWIVPRDSVVLLSDTRDMLGWPDSRFLGFIPRSDILAHAALHN
jgi:signal peptidase I